MKRRQVKIELRERPYGGVYFVLYVGRAKYGRHFAAQFDARFCSLADVKGWIAMQPKLELVDDEKP